MNYERLLSYGDIIPLKPSCDPEKIRNEISQFNFSQYNTSKLEIPRRGLSITSLDGSLNGPDLETLNGSEYDEGSFTTLTEVYYQSSEVRKLVDPFLPHIARSHFLNIKKGGFFPPHRDELSAEQQYMRVIVPIYHFNPPFMYFIHNDKVTHLSQGQAYFVNTNIQHSVFSFSNSSLMVILNLICSEESYKSVMKLFHSI